MITVNTIMYIYANIIQKSEKYSEIFKVVIRQSG
jgi:hypothetical protein